MSKPSQATLRRVKRHDRLARWVVTLGGVVVIVGVLGILVMILGTALPLFLPARARLLAEAPLPSSVKAEGVLGLGIQSAANDSWLVAHVVDSSGKFHFIDVLDGEVIRTIDAVPSVAASPQGTAGKKSAGPALLGATPSDSSAFTLRWSDGTVSLVKVVARTEAAGKILKIPEFTVETAATIPPDKLGVPEQAVLRRAGDESSRCAALYRGKQIVVTRQSEDLSGDKSETRIVLGEDIPGPVTAITLDHSGTMLYAGTASGSILWWRLSDTQVVDRDIVPPLAQKQAITALDLMIGDVTLVAGDAGGGVTNWFFVTPASESQKKPAANTPSMKKEVKKLTYIRALRSHEAAIRAMAPSPRNHALLVADAANVATMDYTTSQRQLLTLHDVAKMAFTPRGDIVAGLVGDQLRGWRIEGSLFGVAASSLHPEVSWSSLWGRVWYEGLNSPEFAWQSTSGTDDYEPKLSLVPLVFGTLKGTFYAMLLAAPLALGAAAYVSHFSSPKLRAWVKPAIEVMACVPSVVLGFLVGLWLAPVIKDGLVALLLSAISIPVVFILVLLLWQQARKSPAAQRRVRSREFLLAGLLLAVGVAVAAWLSAPVEQGFFGGDLTLWLAKHLGMVYDQRNSILIVFGVGFMVIPIIFTLAEDALSSVPHSMTAASMALGASRWQTLWRVVLPSASPGIFAAVMIGFGRAVGETMVFLMATGNSAQIDWSPFNGMRTLSANIAQELPEAAVGGTHYRVLFLCGVVLFMITFMLNTIAEIVRQRLRLRYGQF